MGSQAQGISLADFSFTQTDEITACPEGQKPQRIKTGKHGGTIVHFDRAACDVCTRQSECPVKRVKRSATIAYDAKALRLSRRRAHEKSEAFRQRYRFRAGIEGTMSDLDRMTGIKRLRVRGMPQVRVAAVLKATGLNILRSTAFRNRQRKQESAQNRPESAKNSLLLTVKEQFGRLLNRLLHLSEAIRPRYSRYAIVMAPVA